MSIRRELLPHGGRRLTRPSMASAPANGFDYPATQVGTSGNVAVYYDPALGTQGLQLATSLVGAVTTPYRDMEAFFGIQGSAVTLIVAPLSSANDGSGGAYHYGCDFTTGNVLYVDATFANSQVNPLDLEVGLYVAELSEAFMGPEGKGWGCGYSNGEGLSRFCAERETPNGTLAAFVTAPSWVQAGFPDWVTKTSTTDQDDVSTGCAVLYLYWMVSLGYTVPHIVQAPSTTLAANYQALTGKSSAYADLVAAVQRLSVTSDNPFTGSLA
jgi:hypothetical protein